MPDLSSIDKSWTLFLDRDGVINNEKAGEYILHWDYFVFSDGVLESFQKLSATFGRIIIVTNQKGVGKNLMALDALETIHTNALKKIAEHHGAIAKIYYCTDLDDASPNRKPQPGMALQAAADFPDIDLTRSLMVGNKPSDMAFGRAAGMYTVFVATTNPEVPFPHPDIDFRFQSLAHFTAALP